MRPRTHEDFEILYNELEAWRLLETSKIHEANLPADVKQATLKQLLHKETKLLQTIDRLKIAANHENRDVRIAKTLADMSNAKRWECDDGSVAGPYTRPLFSLSVSLLVHDMMKPHSKPFKDAASEHENTCL